MTAIARVHNLDAIISDQSSWQRYLQSGVDTSQWRRDDILLARYSTFAHSLPAANSWWTAAVFDADIDIEDMYWRFGGVVNIPVQATDRYQNAFEYFDDAMKTVLAKRLRVNMYVSPSDRGLVQELGVVDTRVDYYRMWYSEVRTPVRIVNISCDGYGLARLTNTDSRLTSQEVGAELNKRLYYSLTTPYALLVASFQTWCAERNVQQRGIQKEFPMVDVRFMVDGYFDEEWVFHRVYESQDIARCVVNVFLCPLSVVDRVVARLQSYDDVTVRRWPSVYDKYPVEPDKEVTSFKPLLAWLPSASVRQPRLVSDVIDAVLALHSQLRRYVLLEIIEWLPNMQFMSRRNLDALIESTLASIRRVEIARLVPARNTRSRTSERDIDR